MRSVIQRAVVIGFFIVGGCFGQPGLQQFTSDAGTRLPHSSEGVAAAAPWTHLNFANQPDDFHFAIVSDRCGGHRGEVFEGALDKLNLLRPEFVMSVGDLIEGYSENETVLNGMLDESREMLSRLQMPFFRVPGNHDLGNAAMDKLWEQRFGERYYWFTYKGVLFLCLNTQDNDKRTGLSAKQVAWAREVIAKHADARWTFVFMHQPLWIYDEGNLETSRKSIKEKQDTGFEQIESALAGRNYTVFAGHFHQYAKYVRHGQDYYILASTGAQSDLRGPEYGEFDHVVWVTLQPGRPLVVNLKLDGILRDDVFTEEHMLAAQNLRFATETLPLKSPPVSLTLPMMLTNHFPRAMTVELAWSIPNESAWTVSPARVAAEIPPHGAMSPVFNAVLTQPGAAVVPLPELHATLTITNSLTVGKTIPLPVNTKAYLLANLPEARCRKAGSTVKVDGKLDDPEWQRPPDISRMAVWSLDRNPSVSTRFWLAYDAENLYVAVRCGEPNLPGLVMKATQRDGPCWEDDSIELFVATDPARKTYYQFIVNAADVMFDGKGWDKAWNGKWTAATGREPDGWTLEIAIPWATLGCPVPALGSQLGMELVRTRPQDQTREMLQWAPTTDGNNHNPAMFGSIRFAGAE